MALNHSEYARNLLTAQTYVRPNVVLSSMPDGCQNDHVLYGIQQFAGQWPCLNLQYRQGLLEKRYLHQHPPRSHSLPPRHPVFLPNLSGSHHAGTGPHQWILDQSSQVRPTGPANGVQSTLHHESTHQALAILAKRVHLLNKLMHLPHSL